MATVASAPADFSVFRTLAGSTATLGRAAALGEGIAISQWSRSAHETMGYDNPGHHTLSLYLRGGDKSFRLGQDRLHGGAGKFCVLPSEHYSRWSMNDSVQFLHLYIAPERLAREAVMRLDCEPRTLELRDRTYIHDDSLIDVCRQLLDTDWNQPADRLAASSAAETVLHHLLNQGVARKPAATLRGGLAPAVRRRLMDYVDAHLAEPLTLDELAGVAALSTYHFARMFHTSFGEPPHAWVRARRLAHARKLLAAGKGDLAGIAQASGFGNASHLARVFRDAVGVTPGQYRSARARH
jgi:AraC family transcriptional regulator